MDGLQQLNLKDKLTAEIYSKGKYQECAFLYEMCLGAAILVGFPYRQIAWLGL